MVGYLAAAVAAVGGVYALDCLANAVVKPVPRPPERGVPDLDVDHEDFIIDASGHRLAAWLLKPVGRAKRPVLLLAHGWGASYGTLLLLGEPLVRAGYEVLLFDARGHGRNEAAPYVTVRHFRDDQLAVARYARRRFVDRPLVLIGHSLGGAAGVLATAEGAPVDALVLIATPSDVMRITAEYLSDQGLPGRLMVLALRPFWWRRVRGSFLPLKPSRRINEVGVPLLIIQPENDTRVSRDHADRLAKASGQPYELVAGCEHTDVLGHPETLRLIERFVKTL